MMTPDGNSIKGGCHVICLLDLLVPEIFCIILAGWDSSVFRVRLGILATVSSRCFHSIHPFTSMTGLVGCVTCVFEMFNPGNGLMASWRAYLSAAQSAIRYWCFQHLEKLQGTQGTPTFWWQKRHKNPWFLADLSQEHPTHRATG